MIPTIALLGGVALAALAFRVQQRPGLIVGKNPTTTVEVLVAVTVLNPLAGILATVVV